MPPKRALAAVSPLPFLGGWFRGILLLDYQKPSSVCSIPRRTPSARATTPSRASTRLPTAGSLGEASAQALRRRLRLPRAPHRLHLRRARRRVGADGLAPCPHAALYLGALDHRWRPPTLDRFLDFSGYGIATLIVFQIVVNVGMVTGIMPVVGMTLPFFSKGGSSLVSLCFAVGLMIQARSARSGVAGRSYSWLV